MIIVNIGCNKNKDDAFKFLKENEARVTKAFFVDASKESVDKCSEMYKREIPNLIGRMEFFQFAVMETPDIKNVNFFMPKDDHSSGFSSVDVNMLIQHGKSSLTKISVPCKTINLFFEENNLERIDRLYLDVEGLDSGVLLSLDYSKYDVKYIMFEHLHLDGPHNKYGSRMKNLLYYKLKQHGYLLENYEDWNVIAKKHENRFH